MSQSFGPDDFPNDIKNNTIVNELYGGFCGDEVDKILGDENMTQRKKEDMLFSMLENMNLDVDEDLDVSIEDSKQFQADLHQTFTYSVDLKTEEHKAHLICGRVLSKITEDTER